MPHMYAIFLEPASVMFPVNGCYWSCKGTCELRVVMEDSALISNVRKHTAFKVVFFYQCPVILA